MEIGPLSNRPAPGQPRSQGRTPPEAPAQVKTTQTEDSVEISENARARLGQIADRALQKSGEDVQPVDTTQLNSGDRLAEIRQRIETGFYDTPEARRQIADRLIDDLDL